MRALSRVAGKQSRTLPRHFRIARAGLETILRIRPHPRPMKLASTLLAVLVVALAAGYLHLARKISSLETTLAQLTHDRGALPAELRKLNARLDEVQSRASSGSSATRAAHGAAGSAAVADSKSQTTAPAARPGVTVSAPAGWHKNGAKSESYVVGVDATQTWGGMPSAYVESLTPSVENGFGGMMQTTSAESFVGKRVRLSGWVKTEDANEGGGRLWLRIDGQERGQMLGFDNMQNRAVKGTNDWQETSVVLDVPTGASALAYGFFVSGGGKMWVNGQRIEVVGTDVPTTNMITKPTLPSAPRNLGFDPNK